MNLWLDANAILRFLASDGLVLPGEDAVLEASSRSTSTTPGWGDEVVTP